jgi:heme exporter protein D
MTAEHREWVWAAVAATVVVIDVAIVFGALS